MLSRFSWIELDCESGDCIYEASVGFACVLVGLLPLTSGVDGLLGLVLF